MDLNLVNAKNPIILIFSVILLVTVIYLAFFRFPKSKATIPANFTSIKGIARFFSDKILILLIGILALLVILRPVTGEEPSQMISSNVDVIWLMDVSLSMNVKDSVNNSSESRLDQAKSFVSSFTKDNPMNRYAIVTFHDRANLDLPLTTDTDTAKVGIETILPIESYNTNGSSIKSGLDLIYEKIINNKEDNLKNHKQIVILISDGENPSGKSEDLSKSINQLRDKGVLIYTIGVGSKKGGKIPVLGYNGRFLNYLSFQGKEATSKIDEKALQKIADKGNGKYYNINYEGINSKLKQELNILATTHGSQEIKIYKDLYYFFAGILVLVMIIWHFNLNKSAKLIQEKK